MRLQQLTPKAAPTDPGSTPDRTPKESPGTSNPTLFDTAFSLANVIELQDTLAQLRQVQLEKDELQQQVEVQRKELTRSNFLFREISANCTRVADELRKSAADRIREAKANEELSHEVQQLTASHKQLKDYIRLLIHEFKAPLRGIRSLAQWISQDYAHKLDQPGQEQMKLLVGCAEKLYALMEDVETCAKAGPNTVPPTTPATNDNLKQTQ